MCGAGVGTGCGGGWYWVRGVGVPGGGVLVPGTGVGTVPGMGTGLGYCIGLVYCTGYCAGLGYCTGLAVVLYCSLGCGVPAGLTIATFCTTLWTDNPAPACHSTAPALEVTTAWESVFEAAVSSMAIKKFRTFLMT